MIAFLSSEYAIHLGVIFCLYCITAQGFNIVFGLGGLFNLAHVAFFAVGAYFSAIASTNYDWGFFPCLVGSTLLAGFFSVLIGRISLVLVGFETNLQPTMGNSYTIKAFAAMILGGLGNIWGTIVGAYLLGLIENLAIGLDFAGFSLPAGYKDAFAFAAILLVLLFRPQGLFGVKSRQQ
jgi:branched-chain amino acid transport system permease protein